MSLSQFFYFLFGFALASAVSFILSRLKKNESAVIHQTTLPSREKISDGETDQTTVSAILKNMVEGVIACDRLKRVLTMNPSAESIFGVQLKTALGKSVLEVTRNAAIDQMMDHAIDRKSMVSEEVELHYPGKKTLRLNAVGIEPSDHAHSVSGILVLYDVTDMKKLESLRRDFVANVSHELKTPLTSIKGFIETLLTGALDDRDRAVSFLKMMEEDSERLSRLIRELLELSQIEAKEVSLKRESIDLRKEVEHVLAGFKSMLDEKKITVENKIHGSVFADRDRLRQILINLTGNAVKFNKPGGNITFDGEISGSQARIKITDTGIGISKEAIPRIFERFYRADKARSQDGGGTGLGLAIVKHLVEAHGGTISCESKPGMGSSFLFTLPKNS